ncbi:MAG: hypothetical protein JKY37_18675, partial [Nannocystaceae bacterium]|nr:hypothetical protein [Nannocystaceae bacterium]
VLGGNGSGGGGVALCEAGGDWNAEENEADDGAEDTGFGMGDDMPLSVFQVQQGAATMGVRVAISNVVVTSPASPGEAMGGLEFFVQELEGGPYSGLRVQGFDPLIEGFAAPGDTIDVSGRIAQNGAYYMLLLDTVDDITKVGTAEPPAPPVLTAGELSTQQASARQYEGVVVQVQGATVTDAQPCLGEFTLDDAVRVDDRFVPNALDMPVAGQVIAQVQGVLVFADDEYELAPTLAAD